MGWTFFYMFVVLKIPVALAFYLVWWATRELPAGEEERGDREGGDGGHRHGPRRPRPPRRGPHAERAPSPPRRVRARASAVSRVHAR